MSVDEGQVAAEVTALTREADAREGATGRGAREAVERVTPMMEQFLEIKAANPDCLLFYRMGDFYELFYDDALVASKELQITLTARNKEKDHAVPMCGVPYHSAE